MSSNSDPREAQSPSAYLKPPSSSSARHHSPSSGHQQRRVASSSSGAPAPAPRPPLSIHPTTTIAETAVLHGTYQISIGAGTVIHPRARIYSYEGPVQIGDGCIIGEKSTIGAAPLSSSPTSSSFSTPTSATIPTAPRASEPSPPITTCLSSSVTIGPHSIVLPGAYIHSAAVIDPLATINRNATVGAHSKVSASCEIPEKAAIEDWTVVWATGGDIGRRTRRRRALNDSAAGKRVEDARLIVLHKEREGLVKMIGLSASAAKRR